ncbi:MAG: SAF domain-containing protein [Propionibacteriaceae bacterium]|nr:SAF domain-containing protein [Propionibacteriaceae bacterium]
MRPAAPTAASTIPPTGPVASNPAAVDPSAEDTLGPPPKLRRRPLLIALGVVLVVMSAFVSYYVVSIVKDTAQVVAAVADIPRGQQIERIDLTTVEIRPDPLLKTVPVAQLDELVGKRAATDIPAGVIVAPGSVTDVLQPVAGQALVGVALDPTQRPATAPRHGQPVTFVVTPRDSEDSPSTSRVVYDAHVVDFTYLGDSTVLVVDVTVPESEAAAIVAMAATGRLAAYWNAE